MRRDPLFESEQRPPPVPATLERALTNALGFANKGIPVGTLEELRNVADELGVWLDDWKKWSKGGSGMALSDARKLSQALWAAQEGIEKGADHLVTATSMLLDYGAGDL